MPVGGVYNRLAELEQGILPSVKVFRYPFGIGIDAHAKEALLPAHVAGNIA